MRTPCHRHLQHYHECIKLLLSKQSYREYILGHNLQEIQAAGMHLFIDDSHDRVATNLI